MRTTLLLAFCTFLFISTNVTGQTAPNQPINGPGGKTYAHGGYDSLFYGTDITDMYWLFEPKFPYPDSAPVVTVWHGTTNLMDSLQVVNMHLALIQHLVRKGFTVVYPLYQYGANELSPYSYQMQVCGSIVDAALTRLDDGTHVPPKRDGSGEILLGTAGYSKGGSMSTTLAANYNMLNLPRFRGVMSNVSFDPIIEVDSLPWNTKIVVTMADDDTNIQHFVTVDTLVNRYYSLGHIPCDNKKLLLLHSDNYGSPNLHADHHFYTADPATPSTVNALDFYGGWKLTTALMNCAFYNQDCDYCLTEPDSIEYMGHWSDATPVAEIEILDLDSCVFTGIEELPSLQANLYPNPFVEGFTVDLGDYKGSLTLHLYNGVGQLVGSRRLVADREYVAEFQGLTPGLYIYQISDSNKVLGAGKLLKE